MATTKEPGIGGLQPTDITNAAPDYASWGTDQQMQDPYGWQAWAATQDPDTFGWKQAQGSGGVLALSGDVFQDMANRGLFDPAKVGTPVDPNAQTTGAPDDVQAYDANSVTVTDASGQTYTVPRSVAEGYTQESARGPGYSDLHRYVGPDGKTYDMNITANQKSLHGADYANMASVLMAGVGAGGGLAAASAAQGGGALGAAAVGAEAGATNAYMRDHTGESALKGAVTGGAAAGIGSYLANGALTGTGTDAQTLYSDAGYGEKLTSDQISRFDSLISDGVDPTEAARLVNGNLTSTSTQLTPAAIESAVNTPGYGNNASATVATGQASGINALDKIPENAATTTGGIGDLQTPSPTPGPTTPTPTPPPSQTPSGDPNEYAVDMPGARVLPETTTTTTAPVVPLTPAAIESAVNTPGYGNNASATQQTGQESGKNATSDADKLMQWMKDNPLLALKLFGVIKAGFSKNDSSNPQGWQGQDQSTMTQTPSSGLQRVYVPPPAGYRPGIDPEWNYFQYKSTDLPYSPAGPTTTSGGIPSVATQSVFTPGATIGATNQVNNSTSGSQLTSQQIKDFIASKGLIGSNGAVTDAQAQQIYDYSKQYGVSPAQIDAAEGWAPGTAAGWISAHTGNTPARTTSDTSIGATPAAVNNAGTPALNTGNYTPQQIKSYLQQQGFVDANGGVSSNANATGIYAAMQQYGVSPTQLDSAMGWAPNTAQGWITGHIPTSVSGQASTVDTNAAPKTPTNTQYTPAQIKDYITQQGWVNGNGEVTSDANAHNIYGASQQFGVTPGQIDSALGWAPNTAQNWLSQQNLNGARVIPK